MRYRVLQTGALLFLLSQSVFATTLKFSSEVELLAVDGQSLPSALFKSADSLELNGGVHQILFRVEKMVPPAGQHQQMFTSVPLVVVFDVRDYTSISIKIPKLLNEHDVRAFEKSLSFDLLNNRGNPVEYKSDVLHISQPLLANYEQAMERYNLSDASAALPTLVKKTQK